MKEEDFPDTIYLAMDNSEFTKPLKDMSKWLAYHKDGSCGEIEKYKKLVEFIETKLLAGLLTETLPSNPEVSRVALRAGEVLREIRLFNKSIAEE